MIASEDNILSLIPQRLPFVMVGKLLHADEHVIKSSFTICTGNIFVEQDEFQEAGLIENIAQTMAAGAGYIAHRENKPVASGYIGAVKNLEIVALPKVNDELTTEVVMDNQVFNACMLSGKIWCNDRLIAQCEMKVFTNAGQ